MPNWVENALVIETNHPVLVDMLVSFKEKIDKGIDAPFFETFAPIGEWDYDKALQKWGCKWDASNLVIVNLQEKGDGLVFGVCFTTPWDQPYLFLDHLFKTFGKDEEFYLDIENKWLEEQGYFSIDRGNGDADDIVNIYDLYQAKDQKTLDMIDQTFCIYDNGWFDHLEEDEEDEEEDD